MCKISYLQLEAMARIASPAQIAKAKELEQRNKDAAKDQLLRMQLLLAKRPTRK
jgi:hypothetical protein